MKRILNFLSYYLMLLVFILIIFGGGRFEIGAAKIEVGSVDLWGIAAIFFGALFYKIYGEKPRSYISLVNGIERYSNRRNYYIFFFFFFVSIFVKHVIKHYSFQTHFYDMSYVNPSLFYPFGEKLLSCDACKFGTYLGEHISYTLILMTPLTMLFKSDVIIFLIENILCFVPVFFLIKAFLEGDKKKTALLFFMIILSSRSFRNSMVWDFREDHLGFFFLLMSLIFLYKRKLFYFFLCLILSLFSKEHVGIITAFLGIPIWFDEYLIQSQRKRRFVALSVTFLSIVVVILDFKFFFPLYVASDPSRSNIVLRFKEFGNSPSEIIYNSLVTPAIWWKLILKVFTKEAIKYLAVMLLPFTFLLRRVGLWLIPIFVGLGLNILSPLPNEKMMIFHYDLILLAVLFFAVLYKNGHLDRKKLIFPFIMTIAISGRWPLYNFRLPSYSNISDVAFLNKIPEQLVIGAKGNIIPHLSSKRGQVWIKNFTNLSCSHPSVCLKRAEKIVLKNDDNDISKYEAIGWEIEKESIGGDLILLKRK